MFGEHEHNLTVVLFFQLGWFNHQVEGSIDETVIFIIFCETKCLVFQDDPGSGFRLKCSSFCRETNSLIFGGLDRR